MKGLVKKDLYMTWAHGKLILLICAFYVAAASFGGRANIFWTFYIGMFAGMLPMSFYALDERDGWITYSLTQPHSRGRIASERYVYSLLIAGCGVLLVAAVEALRAVHLGEFSLCGYVFTLVLASAAFVMPATLTLPFMHALGAERGRIAYVVVIVVFVSLFNGIFLSWGSDAEQAPAAPLTSLDSTVSIYVSLMILAAVAALFAVSWAVSVAVFRRREF